jgi:hypothetical protein
MLSLEKYLKLLKKFLRMSLNKWNQREVYSEIAYDYFEFYLFYWII